jgi:protoporphyrin/coproporphyrin ferrochelatase
MIFHHAQDPSKLHRAVLFINFGTPSAPSHAAVKSFLVDLFNGQQFHLPLFLHRLFVRTCIIPIHINKSVVRYQAIWSDEGSPLMVQSEKFGKKLSSFLPEDTIVSIAMQYGQPSIKQVLIELRKRNIDELIIVPLFPQKVPSLTQSILSTVFRYLLQWDTLPKLICIPSFYKDRWYIESAAKRLRQARPDLYDHVVFSFHSIPQQKSADCTSYLNQCHASAQMIAENAGLSSSSISVSFQSKAGIGRWLSPSTRTVLDTLLKQGKKRILVMCPSFMVDCVETLGEIAAEYRADFLGDGGDVLGLVESFNDFQPFVEEVASFLKTQLRTDEYTLL